MKKLHVFADRIIPIHLAFIDEHRHRRRRERLRARGQWKYGVGSHSVGFAHLLDAVTFEINHFVVANNADADHLLTGSFCY